jgi:hypothetical protein
MSPDLKIKDHATIVDNIINLVLNKQETKYDPVIHVKILIANIASGEPVSSFCAQAHICRTTFYHWLKKYPEFKRAYDLSLPVGETIILNMPLKNSEVPFPYWHLRMRNQYQYGKKRLDHMNSDSALERLKGERLTFIEGELAMSEYAQLVTTIVTEIKASELARSLDEATLDGLKDIKTMNKEELNERINVLIRSLECKN